MDNKKELIEQAEALLNDERFNWQQRIQLELGCILGLDFSSYMDPKFSWQQMNEIRYGLRNGIDVSKYADERYTHEQMNELRLGMQIGMNVSNLLDPNISWTQMHRERRKYVNNLVESNCQDLYLQQIDEVKLGLMYGVNGLLYADPKYNEHQMVEIRKGLGSFVDVSKYMDPELTSDQMKSIRIQLESGLEVDERTLPECNFEPKNKENNSMNKSVEQYEINHGVHNWINYRTEIYTDGDIIVDENRSKELTNAVYSNSLGNLYATKEVGIIKNVTYAYLLEGHNRYPHNAKQEWSFSIIDMKTEEIVFQMDEKSNPEMDYGEALQVAYDKLEDMINTDRDKESGESFTEDIDSDLDDFDQLSVADL